MPTSLAVMGWSNGGFLTYAVLAAGGERFRAGIAGAGVVDMGMQWALEDTPGHVVNYLAGPALGATPRPTSTPPRCTPSIGCRRPLLVHCGALDARVPLAHSLAAFRALDFYTDIPTELVVYPDTGHGLYRRAHLEAKMAWDHAWLARWLGTTPAPASATTAQR